VIVCITEGIPAQDEARMFTYLQRTSQAALIGPNCPGVISPGKANVGIMPHEITMPGTVGVVSRSGTLTYQAVHELTSLGIGQSTCIGIGGDPVPGTSFVDVLRRFQDDPGTEAIVMIGEIGGEAEEQAAAFIAGHVTKPVVGYIAGFTAPPGKKMGHAGAIISGSSGTAVAKKEALEAVGVTVVTYPTEIGEAVAGLLG
jgi:succinyl-CoA synthetase alpha subunit